MSAGVSFASASALRHGSSVRSTRSLVSSSSSDRVSVLHEVERLARRRSCAMKGRLISVSSDEDSSCFAFSAASLRRWSAMLVLAQVDAVLLRELLGEAVDDAAVEVLAAEVRVAVRRLDAEDAVADLEDRDVERAAAEVVDGDALGRPSCRARRRARRPWAR